VTKYLTPQTTYDVRPRRIQGSREEKLEQIDAAIQELLDIKTLECATDNPNLRFLAVPRRRSHGAAMVVAILMLLIVLVLLLGVRPGRAQEVSPLPPAPSAWHVGGLVDTAYIKDFNSPSNHLFRARGTTPRVDELDLNMTAAYAKKTATAASRWGLEATVQAGRDSEAFGFSPTAPNLRGADWLLHLGPTDVSYLAPAGRGLAIQGGIFSSLVGYDSLYTKDNSLYTRPRGADFTPYLMLGVNASYPVNDRLTVAGFVVTGYFHLAHANNVPNLGGQIAYALRPHTSLNETALYGPNQSDTSLDSWRILSDTIVERKTPRLTIAAELQLSTESVAGTDARASWTSAQLPIHVVLRGPWSATVRPEFAVDRSGRWTGVSQTVEAITSGLEYRVPFHEAQGIVRVEHRYDNSQGEAGGFFDDGQAGVVGLTPGQHLLVVALILTADHTGK